MISPGVWYRVTRPVSHSRGGQKQMKRYLAVAVAITLTAAAATVAAQAPGWKQRIDASTSATDPDPAGQVKFMAMAGGFHTANPQAATFWNPEEHDSWELHTQGDVRAERTEQPSELSGAAVRRQGPRRGEPDLHVLPGRAAGRCVACKAADRRADQEHCTREECGHRAARCRWQGDQHVGSPRDSR